MCLPYRQRLLTAMPLVYARMAIPLLATSFALEALIPAVVARKDVRVVETDEKVEGDGARKATSHDR